MKCKDIFANSDVVFVPAEENLQRQESHITTYANYHGIKIDMRLGLWVDVATATAERVLRLEFAGITDKPRYKSRYQLTIEAELKREKKKEQFKKLLKEGKNQSEIARELNITRQAVSAFIKYNNINGEIS